MSQLLEKLKNTLDGLQLRISALQADRDILSETLRALAGDYGKHGVLHSVHTKKRVVAVSSADNTYMTELGQKGMTTSELAHAALFDLGVVTDRTWKGFVTRSVTVTTIVTVELDEI